VTADANDEASTEGGELPYEVNKHVERLHRYLPFDASFDQIYEENRHSDDSLELDTAALRYLKAVLTDGPRLILLTGDAGHGKTHLCSRLIHEYLGYTPDATRKAVRECGDGRILEPAETHSDRQRLRLYKDFSEFNLDTARERLAETTTDELSSTSIVCVNEGRLRSILSSADDPRLSPVRRAFNDSFVSGLASGDGQIHVINLNYQSVAAPPDSLLERVLSGEAKRLGWLAKRRWSACDGCAAVNGCPIRKNAALLQGDTGRIRRERLSEVMAVAERLGTVITIREILMTAAYLITGGLRCGQVHERHQKYADGWQHEYMFYSLLFTAPAQIGHDKLARIPVLASLKKLDPGLISDRTVDEHLINEPDAFADAEFELIFTGGLANRTQTIDAKNGIDEILADARNRVERDAEARFTRDVIRSLRRRDFFDHRGADLEARRLGFRFYDDFRWLVGEQPDNTRRVKIKNQLIAGLHTIQGLRLPRSESNLHLVDPAFGRTTNHAAIIARKIPSSLIKLTPQSQAWEVSDEKLPYALFGAVDWIDRVVVLTVETKNGDTDNYPLDLLTFDCIMRAASGYLPDGFYGHDVRRIMNFLGLLAERRGASYLDTIDVMVRGRMHTVTLEEGGVIVVSGTEA
jgi:hypothetical protein